MNHKVNRALRCKYNNPRYHITDEHSRLLHIGKGWGMGNLQLWVVNSVYVQEHIEWSLSVDLIRSYARSAVLQGEWSMKKYTNDYESSNQ